MTPRATDDWCRSLSGQIVGKFRLLDFVGAGKIGYVYRAEHQHFPESIRAVKLTFDEVRVGWDVELRKVIRLELVDGVVHLHDLGGDQLTHDGRTHLYQYTVWDYIAPGRDLRAYLKHVGKIPTSFLLAVVERLLHVLHACNAQGVVRHGDLHSGNILIGDQSTAKLDDSLEPRAPIYVSDFGYGATGGARSPKDDYEGLAQIINEMIPRIEYATATATHRQILQAMQRELGKLLKEPAGPERHPPLELLRVLNGIKQGAQGGRAPASQSISGTAAVPVPTETPNVGQFQVSEMIGDRWDWWRRLFVPTVPARSKILALDIPTVVTGPRGCGKTMFLRRLSERLIVECGDVAELSSQGRFVALYVNANDFADAFARYPDEPTAEDERHLTCYANLCVLADLLTVQSARAGQMGEVPTDTLLALVQSWLVPDTFDPLIVGEDRLERYRAVLEQIKWSFPLNVSATLFPGYDEFSQHRWLPRFVQQIKACCPWIADRSVLLFIDDFSTPRVSASMQRVLNRLLLQRSPDFLAKVATEAWSTFVPEDSSGKVLQDGDDYQLVDMGEESLFLPELERRAFLRDVFQRRLAVDPRLPPDAASLELLLGRLGLSKTEFARRLRTSLQTPGADQPAVAGSQRRGRSRGRVHYFGEDVFCGLWSGDTRTMIQLITDVVDHAFENTRREHGDAPLTIPINSALQDKVFRNRGGEWLDSHTRNEPTNPDRVKQELAAMLAATPSFALQGQYGDHLKAVVEAFVAAAKRILLGPTYTIKEKGARREVPRMAFRLEIIDDFRIDGLAREIYRDLIRYGLFMRDNRGKSVRGAFVPRLYLRRLLLPFCTLALSKRDSVQLTSDAFTHLLLEPDAFKAAFVQRDLHSHDQLLIPFGAVQSTVLLDTAYDDIEPEESLGETNTSDMDDE